VPGVVAAAAGDERVGVCAGGHWVSPGAQPRRALVQAEKAGRGQDAEEASASQAKKKETKQMHTEIKVAL
jgi:hypothetical protein